MNENPAAGDVISALMNYANDERKKTNEWFFKTGKGEYGEGDVFIGVRVPHSRKVAKQFRNLPLEELKILLYNKIHEVRLCAIHVLVEQMKHAKTPERTEIVEFYLQHKAQVNNWDLVDCSAHYVLGQAILDGLKSQQTLFDLAASDSLWDRRIAMVSTWLFIRNGNTKTTLKLAKILLSDREDLMNKAVGWMLREAWKKAPESGESFLQTNYDALPRTTLRYAIERMEESKRKRFLRGEF